MSPGRRCYRRQPSIYHAEAQSPDERQSPIRAPRALTLISPAPGEGKGRGGSTDAALELAVAALGFIAIERDELSRFLALTGIDPSLIRTAAKEPGFLSGVL